VDVGGTVVIASGTYTENVDVDKRLTLSGAGKDSAPASNTIITSAAANTPVITIKASGTAASPLTIESLRVTNASGGSGNNESGILLRRAGGIEHILFDYVASVGNGGSGISADITGDISNITVQNCVLSNNGANGFRIPSSANSATDIVIDNCTIDNNNIAGIIVYYNGGIVREISVSNTTLTGNGGLGSGDGGIILYQYNNTPNNPNLMTANFTNVTITGPAGLSANTSGFYINCRNANTAPGTYTFNNVEVNGNGVYDIRFRRCHDLSGVTMNYVRLYGNSINGIRFVDIEGPLVDLGNTKFSNTHTFDIEIENDDLISTANIDATGAIFVGATTLAEVQARVKDDPPTTGKIFVVPPDTIAPTVISNSLSAVMTKGPTQIEVTFGEEVIDLLGDADPDDVTNPDNYKLTQKGANGAYDFTACNDITPGDDVFIPIGPVSYDNNTFTATVTVNGGTPLPDGEYRFFVCGTTSILDMWDIPLDDGADFQFDFSIGSIQSARFLPRTGFPPGSVLELPAQPPEKAYNAISELILEIPKLGLEMPIVGVPVVDGAWDVSWLGESAGYLNGTAFPTTSGNTGITAHVWDADNRPGPFANLKSLRHSDLVKIHAWGFVYTYAVRYNYLTTPENMNPLRNEAYDWVTLLTCERYSSTYDSYRFRRVVRAVLVDVTTELDV
jgi:LPXTG-site transpeptidase (sortase) family protein